MARLRLVKGLSYDGAVHATQKSPLVIVTDENVIASLISEGNFVLDTQTNTCPEADSGNTITPEQLAAMTKQELKAYAESNNIDITGCNTKADLMQAISAHNGGSYTMMELQKSPNYEEEE